MNKNRYQAGQIDFVSTGTSVVRLG